MTTPIRTPRHVGRKRRLARAAHQLGAPHIHVRGQALREATRVLERIKRERPSRIRWARDHLPRDASLSKIRRKTRGAEILLQTKAKEGLSTQELASAVRDQNDRRIFEEALALHNPQRRMRAPETRMWIALYKHMHSLARDYPELSFLTNVTPRRLAATVAENAGEIRLTRHLIKGGKGLDVYNRILEMYIEQWSKRKLKLLPKWRFQFTFTQSLPIRTVQLFQRIRHDARERRNPAYQQRGLEDVLDSLVSEEDAAADLRRIVMEGRRVPREEMEKIKTIKGFWDKPPAARKRIIQERSIQRMGRQIMLIINGVLEAERQVIEIEAKEPGANEAEINEMRDRNAWLRQAIKHADNQQFLVDKVKQWHEDTKND